VPSVRITAVIPLKVCGLHFVSGETVRVTVAAGKARFAKTAVASAAGGFLVSFGLISRAAGAALGGACGR
jgi:hypothetical protein